MINLINATAYAEGNDQNLNGEAIKEAREC